MKSSTQNLLILGGLAVGAWYFFIRPTQNAANDLSTGLGNLANSGAGLLTGAGQAVGNDLSWLASIFNPSAWGAAFAGLGYNAGKTITPALNSPQVTAMPPSGQAAIAAAMAGGGQAQQLAAANLANYSNWSPQVAAQFANAGLISGTPAIPKAPTPVSAIPQSFTGGYANTYLSHATGGGYNVMSGGKVIGTSTNGLDFKAK